MSFSHKEHKEHKEFSRENLKGEMQYEKDDDSCDDGGVRGFNTLHSTNTGGGNFGIIRGDMDSLSLQKTLLERMTYAGDGMGVGAFYFKEVA